MKEIGIKSLQVNAIERKKQVQEQAADSMPFTMKTPDRLVIIQAYDKDDNKRVITFSFDKHEWFEYENRYGIMMEKFVAHLHEIVRMDKSIVWYKTDGYILKNGTYINHYNFNPQYI